MFSEHFSFDHDVDNLKDFQKKRPVVLETSQILIALANSGPTTIQRNNCEWSSARPMNRSSPFIIFLFCSYAWSMRIAEKLQCVFLMTKSPQMLKLYSY